MEDVKVLTFEDIYGEGMSPKASDPQEVEEFNSLAQELGLNNLVLDKEANPEQIRLPKLNPYESQVYHVLCPRTIRIEDYKEEMPIRVLKALKLAKDMVPDDYDFFIMKAGQDPDPILVAKRYSFSDDNTILIARWGEELLDFPSLAKRAKEKIVSLTKSSISDLKGFIHKFEQDPDAHAEAVITRQTDSIKAITRNISSDIP